MLQFLLELIQHEPVAVAIITAISSVATALIYRWFTRRRLAAESARVAAEAKFIDASAAGQVTDTLNGVINRLEVEIAKLNLKVGALEKNLEDALARERLLTGRIEQLEANLTIATAKEKDLNLEISKLRTTLAESDVREHALRKQVNKLEAENCELRTRLDAAEAELKTLKKQYVNNP